MKFAAEMPQSFKMILTAVGNLAYKREDGSLSQFRDDDDIRITTAIEEAFEEAGFDSADYNVTSSVVFSCPSADFGYVSVAWVQDGKLYRHNYVFE